MPTKIAIVTPTFPPYRGGIGTLAELDAHQLAALGYDVHVFTPRIAGAGERSARSYVVHELPVAARYGNAALVPGVVRTLRQYPLVLLNYPFFGAAEILELAKRFGAATKMALIYHMDVVGRGWLKRFFGWHTRHWLPRILAAADRVLVTSYDYARGSDIAPFLGRETARFRELAPSANTTRFAPGAKLPALLARYGLHGEERVVLFVGGLDKAHYFKGIPILLKALATRDLAEARCLIVGDGNLRPEYERLAKELGLGRRVIFTGAVSDAELPDHFRLADVFAFPSIDKSEAFGIAALEALASGVPVVASDLAGVRTIVRHGETGYCVPPQSVSAFALRLADLLGDDSARQRFGTAARQMVLDEYSDAVRQKKLGHIVAELLK